MLQEHVYTRQTRASSTRDLSAGSRLTVFVGFSVDGTNSGIGLLSAKQRARQKTRDTAIQERRIMASAVFILICGSTFTSSPSQRSTYFAHCVSFLEIESSDRNRRVCGSTGGTNLNPKPPSQMPRQPARRSVFELGAWCFFGAWRLELGAFYPGLTLVQIWACNPVPAHRNSRPRK